jgi:uncharacterized repeat protein (TIGR01451 family)
MKRKLIAFSTIAALMLSMLSVIGASAHFVEIEAKNSKVASRGDWFGVPGTGTGSVVTQRNSAQQGEVIFNDATKDQRLIVATQDITRAADLDWFGVTADANNIYFLAKVERYQGITQDHPIELMISIDTNHQAGQGTLALPNTAGISVTNDAAWEFVVDTKFNKGAQGVSTSGSTTIYTTGGSSSSCNTTTCPIQLASSAVTQGSFAEIAVPWSKLKSGNLDAKPTGANYLRFTVSTFYADRTLPPTGNQNTAVIDILDRSSSTAATEAAIADGQMDDGSAFDVHFDTNGGAAATYEPYAPLLITEIQANPLGDDNPGPNNPVQTESEYVEIYNPNSFAISLSDYKLGNAVTRGSSKTMLRFKTGSIGPNGVIVVAKSKTRFQNGYKARHNGAAFPGVVLDQTSDMTPYTAFATGTVLSLDNAPSGSQTELKEQVVLLDEKDGIVDVVSYGNAAKPYPGQVQIDTGALVPEGSSFERCPVGIDTNGGFNPISLPPTNVDFITHQSVDDQTPGVACEGRPGVDMAIEKIGPQTVQVGQPVRFELKYSNVGIEDELSNTQVTIVDTLPAGLSYTPGNASPAPASVNGKVLTWNLPAPAHGGLDVRTIVLTATVDAGLGENVAVTNAANISSPNELKDSTTQSNNTATWTVTTIGPAKLALQLSGLGKTPPGKQFGFQINYQNVGADVAENGVVTLNLPANVTLISATAPGATPNFSGPQVGPKTLSWNLTDPLASQQGGAITIIGQVASNLPRGSTLNFSATFTSSSLNANIATATGSLEAIFNDVFVPLIRK